MILNATGYIVAAHRIELASKVVGKVAWIGVDKGDHVQQGQVLVRLEDEEYKAQVQQAQGNLANLQAHLQELLNGSRPEEIEKAKADLDSAQADLVNAKPIWIAPANWCRIKSPRGRAWKTRWRSTTGRWPKWHRWSGPTSWRSWARGSEEIDAARGQIVQAQGQLAYAQTQLDNTVIRAPGDRNGAGSQRRDRRVRDHRHGRR